jgi:diguanylate cyclase (GGDEF)-like protein/PAS domain S-box-containing protein
MFWRFALVFVLLWLLVVGVMSILVRNKEKREAAEALLETKQMLLEIAEHSHTVSWQIDATGLYSYVSEASIIVFGYHPEELVGKKYFYDLHPAEGREAFKQSVLALAERRESFQNFENKIQKKSGEVVWVATNALPVIDKTGVLLGYRGSDHDIHDRKQVELALERLAHYDPLTNLPNRVLLAKEMKSAMAQALQSQRRLAIVFIDLDGFKDINDACGHKIGDWVLVELSERMRHVMATKGFVARTGGDEFVAIITSLDVDESCLMVVNELLKVIALPMQHPDIEDALQVSGSIGVTVYPQSESLDAEQLLRQADQAMYQAKLSGKNRCYLFDTAQDSHLRDHHESLERIEYALTHDELVLYYQPKINMRSGEVHGFEALIRWQHPERGLLPPMTFLPEIEGHALEVKVGNWVIDQALTQIETLFATNVVHQVSVNIAAFHLLQPDFVAQLEAHLARHPNVPKYALEMELLETSALEDMGRVSEIIHACAALGVHFALDDFGTGYSSLAYLKRLPAPMLKIDQSFVRDMLSDADDLAIIQGVLGLAKAFHRQVIAEGVESEAHGVQLLAMGCELAQGYAVSKPMPEHEVLPWLTQWKPFSSWQVN